MTHSFTKGKLFIENNNKSKLVSVEQLYVKLSIFQCFPADVQYIFCLALCGRDIRLKFKANYLYFQSLLVRILIMNENEAIYTLVYYSNMKIIIII